MSHVRLIMAMIAAQIQVYVSFPHAVALGADLNVDPTNWHWVHCLTIPLETFNTLQFSKKPYNWIRYAIGVVIGAEGDLSSSSSSSNVICWPPSRVRLSILSHQ